MEPKYSFRPVVAADYPALIAFWNTQPGVHLTDADSEAAISRYLERNVGLSFLAVDAAGIQATALAGHDGRRGYLFHVAVSSEYRGLGLARELLERCYSGLRAQGIAKCYVFILQENESGKEYWSKQGWSAVNEFNIYSRVID